MSETINLTIVSNDPVIKVKFTEEGPITVSFYDVALPDPRVTQALIGAQEAEASAQAILSQVINVQENINEIIEQAVIEVSSNSIVNALIFG